MDAVKYLKEKARLTKNCTLDCGDCWLSHVNNDKGFTCRVYEMEFPKEAVATIEKWAAEHPVKTRQDEFLKMFPNAGMEDGIIKIDPCKVDTKNIPHNGMVCDKYDLCADCRRDYWLAEVELWNRRA